jgi:hypothetical protein
MHTQMPKSLTTQNVDVDLTDAIEGYLQNVKYEADRVEKQRVIV